MTINVKVPSPVTKAIMGQVELVTMEGHHFSLRSKISPQTRKRFALRSCVTCLYRVGFGLTRIGKKMRMNKAIVRKWLIKTPHWSPPINSSRKAGSVVRSLAKQRRVLLYEQVIFDGYAKDAAQLRKLDELFHWSNHPEAKRWANNQTAARQYSKWKQDPGRLLKMRLRSRMYRVLKGSLKSAPTLHITGCNSIAQLKQHLESQFLQGMSWDNYGEWEIDHIVPCSSFDLTQPEQQRQCFHFSNLRPLWKSDNRRKHATIVKTQPQLLLNAA